MGVCVCVAVVVVSPRNTHVDTSHQKSACSTANVKNSYYIMMVDILFHLKKTIYIDVFFD